MPAATSPNAACDVLIIGAGVVGTAIAYDLRSRGVDVVLVDRGRVGGASSALNAGGVRHQFFHEPNIRAAKATIELMRRFRDEFGVDSGFRQLGYLFLYTKPRYAERFQLAVDRQSALGVPTRMVSVDDIGDIAPDVNRDGLLGGCFGAADGFMDPRAVMAGFEAGARRRGVRIVDDCEVVGIETAGDRVAAVVTSKGRFAPRIVVNAAGAWGPKVAALYGQTLPITPRRSQVFVMESTPRVSRTLPHTFDCDASVYIRVDGEGIRAGAGYKPLVPGPPPSIEAEWTEAEELTNRIAYRVPGLAGEKFGRAWAGLIEVTPDENPLIGWSLENLYTAAGFSGHGMCIGPGLAPAIAADIVGAAPYIPLDMYRLDRFRPGVPLNRESLWLMERVTDFSEWVVATAR
jgi:sarcosine oxidase subunit beta